jgi:hypothetical protein
MRHLGRVFFVALLLALSSGCSKSAPNEKGEATTPKSAPQPASSSVSSTNETVARIHWLGIKHLPAQTNSTFLEVWNMPESQKLKAQTLDRICLAPWGTLQGKTNAPDMTVKASAALLRPLLEDLLDQESYLEIRNTGSQPGDLALAVRLDAEHAGRWQTNLAAVLESLTGAHTRISAAPARGWQLSLTNRSVRLAQEGEWTVLGFGPENNPLSTDLLTRIQRDHAPTSPGLTNVWLEADLDLRYIANALSLASALPEGLPKFSVAMLGEGENVRTRGEFNFPKPLPFELEAWNIPTNLIHDPLVSFTAIQGIKGWLSSMPLWNNLHLGTPPNQFYFWSQDGVPFLAYAAAPFPDASNQVYQLSEHLIKQANPWLETNGTGRFEPIQGTNGASWTNLLLVTPWLQTIAGPKGDFAFAALTPDTFPKSPPPAKLLEQLNTQSNLVCLDWEMTGPRIESDLYISQFFRLALHKAQVPPKSLSVEWLRALEYKLGNTITAVTRTGPAKLSLVRKSDFGFTASELHLLVDWLESPQIPIGLHTFLAPPDILSRKKSPPTAGTSSTNSTPPATNSTPPPKQP